MSPFTLDQFISIAKRSAGEDGSVVLDSSIGDQTMRDLNIDSLSIVAISDEIEQEFGQPLPREVLATDTPNTVVDLMNGIEAETTAAGQ